jgi:catalase
VANIAGGLAQVSKDEIIERSVAHFRAADAEYGERIAAAVAKLRAE